jgi:hypothetical protein
MITCSWFITVDLKISSWSSEMFPSFTLYCILILYLNPVLDSASSIKYEAVPPDVCQGLCYLTLIYLSVTGANILTPTLTWTHLCQLVDQRLFLCRLSGVCYLHTLSRGVNIFTPTLELTIVN